METLLDTSKPLNIALLTQAINLSQNPTTEKSVVRWGRCSRCLVED